VKARSPDGGQSNRGLNSRVGQGARLNDTAGLASRPLEGTLEHSRTVEKVGQAYLVTERTWNSKTGDCKVVKSIEGEPPRVTGPNDAGLRGAMDYLNDDKPAGIESVGY
jgi:hypothetical protein